MPRERTDTLFPVAGAAIAGRFGESACSVMLRAPVEGRRMNFAAPLQRCAACLGPSPASVCLAFPVWIRGKGVLHSGPGPPGES